MILSNAFTHDSRVYNEALSLTRAGHEVTVLGWDRNKKEKKVDNIDGIGIVRFRNTKFMDLLRLDIIRLRFWWKNGYKLALELHEKKAFDAIHCHDLDTLPIGVNLKKILRIPLVYDAHEIFGYMLARDLPTWWANTFLKKEKKLLPAVNRIITVNEPLKEYFTSISEVPITIIMNCKRLLGTEYEGGTNDKLILIYIGTLGKSRFLLEIANAVKEIPDVHCIIGGWGKADYVDELQNRCSGAKNAEFIGLVPPNEVLPMTKSADVVICMTNPADKNNSRASANKQFEAMVCGRPIICTEGTYPGELTTKENVGITADYTESSLKDAIIKLRDDPDLRAKLGMNALNAAINKYNWEKQEEMLKKVYEGYR